MSPKTDSDWRSTSCVLCSLNCGLRLRVENNRITKVKGDRPNPFSRGYTCSKGLTVAKYAHHDQRVLEHAGLLDGHWAGEHQPGIGGLAVGDNVPGIRWAVVEPAGARPGGIDQRIGENAQDFA